MCGKSKRRTIIKILGCLFLFGILLRYSLDIDLSSTDVTDVNLIHDAFQRAQAAEIDFNKKYQFTAIVLHWKSLTRVQRSVENFLNTKMFKEIIVWNNNPQIKLAHNQVIRTPQTSTLVYIINSNENLKDQAKYRACVGAQTLVCFYADDDWDTSKYVKTLIASFRSDPSVLHIATNDITYYNNMLWTFMDRQIDLHAGFAWIGCGSIFLREHAERHLQLLSTNFQYNEEIYAYSDVFFSIWLNDIPSQLLANLRSVPLAPNETHVAFSSTNEFPGYFHTSAILAIRKLDFALRLNQSRTNVNFPRQQRRRFPYCVRSPSLDDDLIFFSNVLPVAIEHTPFDIMHDADRGTYRNTPSGPNYTHFVMYNTLKAVDDDRNTCWRPLGTVKKGDFFAIDFLHLQNNITFALTIGHSWKLQKSLDLRVSFDGILWLSYPSFQSMYIKDDGSSTPTLQRFVLESKNFSPGFRTFRYIAFNATYDYTESFQICDVRIIKNS